MSNMVKGKKGYYGYVEPPKRFGVTQYVVAISIFLITAYGLYRWFYPPGYDIALTVASNVNKGVTLQVENLKDKFVPHNYHGSIAVTPAEGDDNTVTLKLKTDSPAKGEQVLRGIVRKYNAKHSKPDNRVKRATEVKDSIQLVSKRLASYASANGEQTGREHIVQVIKSLQALDYYVKKPIDHFEQIPNTFEVDSKVIITLVDYYNKLQNDKQHLLTADFDVSDELAFVNKQLLAVQNQLDTGINANILKLQTRLNNRNAFNKSFKAEQNELLAIKTRLLHEKAQETQLDADTQSLKIVGEPVIMVAKPPYLAIGALALLMGLLFMLAYNYLVLGDNNYHIGKGL
ncbi:hypothetical protein GCM10023149_51380 [Mucilaginibacter gynuensis]|uniref:Subunit length determinant protein n=1 Tax=Mucilaginibacter gynuensis TaxID=1302236 RepID=A0ABP8HJT2_9SPHI